MKVHFNKYQYILFALLLSVFSCKDAKPQTKVEKEKVRKTQLNENHETLFLGAIQACSQTDYTQYFKSPRTISEPRNGDCCTYFVPSPYINPLEYYFWVFEKDREIFDNQNNPFELKKIREKWAKKTQKIADKAASFDSENLIYETKDLWSVKDYDFSNQKLILSWANLLNTGSVRVNLKPLSHKNLRIEMTENDVEKLYNYYEEMDKKDNRSNNILIKPLNSRITYAIRKPERRDHLGKFDVVIKKVELFYPDDWSKKIGELIF